MRFSWNPEACCTVSAVWSASVGSGRALCGAPPGPGCCRRCTFAGRTFRVLRGPLGMRSPIPAPGDGGALVPGRGHGASPRVRSRGAQPLSRHRRLCPASLPHSELCSPNRDFEGALAPCLQLSEDGSRSSPTTQSCGGAGREAGHLPRAGSCSASPPSRAHTQLLVPRVGLTARARGPPTAPVIGKVRLCPRAPSPGQPRAPLPSSTGPLGP